MRSRFFMLKTALLLCSTLLAGVALADSFRIADIEIRGLSRINESTVLSYLPINKGEEFDTARTSYVIHELYNTGFFAAIDLLRDGDKIIVQVTERPAITDVKFDGNEDVDDDQLKEALKKIGIVAGRVYHRSMIDTLEQNLQQVYFSHGKYGVKIKTDIEELDKNRVKININISEGLPALIKQINIVGNTVFTDEQLVEDFSLEEETVSGGFHFEGDQYSRPVLTGDLEKLKSYYQDRGYINFSIESTQVSISPDKKDIYITVNVQEGDKYTVESVTLTGDFVFPEDDFRKLIALKAGDVFSQRGMVNGKTAISQMLGDAGYAFSRVDAASEPDDEKKTVKLTYVIQPGKKAYVRSITFSGNNKTHDDVLRREMRLFEGGELNVTAMNRSKIRLQRLAFIERVEMKNTPVPGTNDQVDLDIQVDERLSGSFNISAGYSQVEDLIFGLSLSQDNLFGTGQRLTATINTSKTNTVYSIIHTDPYYTEDGISRTFELNYRQRDASQELISNYLIDTAKLGVRYGVPISEYDYFNFGFGVETADVTLADTGVPQEIVDYIATNGDYFENLGINLSYSHDTRNRTVFATGGLIHSISMETTLPESDLTYYKVSLSSKLFFDLGSENTLMFRINLGYGAGYGDTEELPFFERYFAGGLRSVRGYATNSLGPYDAVSDDVVGGDMSVIAGLEWIFPVPFMEKPPSSVRMSLFYDAGNVFNSADTTWEDSFSQLYDSVGISYVWLAPIGPLRFSWATALSNEDFLEKEKFQFSIGSFF